MRTRGGKTRIRPFRLTVGMDDLGREEQHEEEEVEGKRKEVEEEQEEEEEE